MQHYIYITQGFSTTTDQNARPDLRPAAFTSLRKAYDYSVDLLVRFDTFVYSASKGLDEVRRVLNEKDNNKFMLFGKHTYIELKKISLIS